MLLFWMIAILAQYGSVTPCSTHNDDSALLMTTRARCLLLLHHRGPTLLNLLGRCDWGVFSVGRDVCHAGWLGVTSAGSPEASSLEVQAPACRAQRPLCAPPQLLFWLLWGSSSLKA